MDVHYSSVVIDKRTIVGTLRLAPTPLSIEQQVERYTVGKVRSVDRLHFGLRRYATVEVRLRQPEVQIRIPNGIAKLMRDFKLQVLQQGTFASDQQLMVPHAGEFTPEADRNRRLQPKLPFLEFAAREHAERRGALFSEVAMVLID